MSHPNRRRFLQLVVVATATPLAATFARNAVAADLPHLDQADTMAGALGYVHDSVAVDAAKYPSHEPEQACAGCNLAQAAQGDGWLPCNIFPGKVVSPKGWCAAWVPKA